MVRAELCPEDAKSPQGAVVPKIFGVGRKDMTKLGSFVRILVIKGCRGRRPAANFPCYGKFYFGDGVSMLAVFTAPSTWQSSAWTRFHAALSRAR